MKKRIEYLDIVKVIAIFLVVFCHFVLLSESIPSNLFMSACWSGVPMFFMVNGALLFTRPLNLKKHIYKTLTTYLVLVIWRLIYLLSIGAINHVPVSGFGKNELFLYLFAFGNLEGIGTGHLWFIEALLAVYVLFPLFRICFDLPFGGKMILFFAIYGLVVTNGMNALQILLDGLAASGRIGTVSLSALGVLNPFGTYANMLGFFLLRAWIHTGPVIGKSLRAQRLIGAAMAVLGLPGIWAVKWYLSGTPAWDGILLAEGYRHIPVILLAVGIFLLCRDLTIKNRFLSAAVRAVAKRTLGIYYLHWIFGWLLVPHMALLFSRFSVASNILKTLALILPALLVTFFLEKIPAVRKLVTG